VRLGGVEMASAATAQDIDRQGTGRGETSVLEILSYLIGVGVLVCHILICVKIIQAGQTALGVVLLILFCCFGIGFLITLIYGWMKAKDWKINPLMTIYTILFVAYLGLVGARFNEIKEQIQKAYQKQGG
jgi:hypothetical protein